MLKYALSVVTTLCLVSFLNATANQPSAQAQPALVSQHPMVETTQPQTVAVNVPKIEKLQKPKYYVALMAVFRNEAGFLKEWIEFYRLMGVEHFYLFNHFSTDNYMDVLKPYIDAGIVELAHINEEANDWPHWNRIQCGIYTDTAHKVKNDVEWLVVVDTDEFMFPVKDKHTDLPSVLREYDDCSALAVNWQMYGSDNVEDLAPGELLTEKLTKSSDEAKADVHVKVIVKPRYVNYFSLPHNAEMVDGLLQVDENRRAFSGPFIPSPSREIVRINHYWSRTWKFFREVKLKRVHMVGEREAMERRVTGYSVTPDPAIARFIPGLKARMTAVPTIQAGIQVTAK